MTTETKAVAVNRRSVERIKAAMADSKCSPEMREAYAYWLPAAEELLTKAEAEAVAAYEEAKRLGYMT